MQMAHKLPAKYYTAIGELMAGWSHFEYGIERIIWLLLNINHREGRVLTTGMQARPKLDILRMLGQHYATDKHIKAGIEHVCKAAIPLAVARNDIAHGVWVHPQGNKRLLHVMKASGKIENRLAPLKTRYTDRNIAKYAKAIRKLAFDTIWIRTALHFPPEPSPKKQPAQVSASQKPPMAKGTRPRSKARPTSRRPSDRRGPSSP